jgi:UDP-glucuronate 4-epimerase
MTPQLDPPLSVLVTGAAGFIASHLVDELLACGYLVRGLDRRCPHRDPAANLAAALAHPRFRYLHADLTHDNLEPAVDGCPIVYHFAAPPVLSDIRTVQLGLPPADAHATANLLHACEDAGVVRLVFASSTSVYRPNPDPSHETELLKPRTVHGWTKLASEQMCLAHGIPSDATMSVVALRYNNVYGPRQNPSQVIPRILAAVHTGAPVDLFGTPAGPPQFLHVFDAVRAALTAAAAPIREAAVNIAGEHTATTAQLVGLVRHLTGVTVHVTPGHPRAR